MLSKKAANRFLKWSCTFAVFVSKLNIACGAAWAALGMLRGDSEMIDHGIVPILASLLIWPAAAWMRDQGSTTRKR